MVDGDLIDKIGAGILNFLKPNFSLGAGVREEEGGAGLIELAGDSLDEFDAEVPGPREGFNFVRDEGFNLDDLILIGGDHFEGSGTAERSRGFLEIAKGGGESPDADRWDPGAEAGEAELGLDASFRSEEFMPFVDDDAF